MPDPLSTREVILCVGVVCYVESWYDQSTSVGLYTDTSICMLVSGSTWHMAWCWESLNVIIFSIMCNAIQQKGA